MLLLFTTITSPLHRQHRSETHMMTRSEWHLPRVRCHDVERDISSKQNNAIIQCASKSDVENTHDAYIRSHTLTQNLLANDLHCSLYPHWWDRCEQYNKRSMHDHTGCIGVSVKKIFYVRSNYKPHTRSVQRRSHSVTQSHTRLLYHFKKSKENH